MKPQKGKYVIFRLGKDIYGIQISDIQEIDHIRAMRISPVPKAPQYLKGIINLRGTVISVIDAQSIMNIKREENTMPQRIIILGNGSNKVGLLVDKILPLMEFSEMELYENPELNEELDKYAIGIGKKQNKAIFILDAERFMKTEEKVVY